MDSNEALDRELIVERAEALRAWLRDLSLSELTAEALERELLGILANDPGGYINGQRPLAGLTIADFVADLRRPGGGAVARVRNLGAEALAELRAALDDDAPPPRMAPPLLASDSAPIPPPAERTRYNPSSNGRLVESAGSSDALPPDAGERAEHEALSAGAGAPADEDVPAALEPQLGEPEQPQASAALPPPAVPTGLAAVDDAALRQLLQLWPALHPQARRAVVLYTSTLLVESLIADAT